MRGVLHSLACVLFFLPGGVIGNTSPSGGEVSWFESRPGSISTNAICKIKPSHYPERPQPFDVAQDSELVELGAEGLNKKNKMLLLTHPISG